MKKIKAYFTLILSVLAIALPAASSSALDTKSDVAISVQTVFSIEFYTDANVLYSTTVPFTGVDPSKSFVYPDGRAENDGKSDVGIICKSNTGKVWNLKISGTPSEGLAADKVTYYMDRPYNRNTGQRVDGTLTQTPNWYSMPVTPVTVYTSGSGDTSNLPFGTLATFSYALVPSGLESGEPYTLRVTYTMTTTA